MQELLFTRDVVLMSEDRELPLSDIEVVLELLRGLTSLSTVFDRLMSMLALRREIQVNGNQPPTTQLLSAFMHRKAKDQRDNIYGLLGLAKEQACMRPNYAQSARRVFIQTAAAIVQQSRTSELLCFKQDPKLRAEAFMKR